MKSDLSASVGETSQQWEKQDFSHTPFSHSKCHHRGIKLYFWWVTGSLKQWDTDTCSSLFVPSSLFVLQLYFCWVTGSLKQWEWLIDILRQMESVEQNNVVETHIFITQLFKHFDLRTSLLVRDPFIVCAFNISLSREFGWLMRSS